MTETDELRQMILNFRCSELQVLLGFAGRNKTGRKQELQSRALELLKLRSIPVQMKIKELHRRYPGVSTAPKTYPTQTANSTSTAQTNLKNTTHQAHYQTTSSPQVSSRTNPYSHPRIAPLDYSSKHSLSSHHTGSTNTSSNNSNSHANSHANSNNSSGNSNNYPVHPDVKFKRLPFYDVLGELLKPATLVPSTSQRFQENDFVFHLTPQQAHDIAMSRDMRPTIKQEFSVQVQLRFCLLETSCEQDDNFPPSICVKVNSKISQLPNPIPTNKPNVEPKRPSRPVNITALCKLSPTVPNHVNVSWASEFGRGYAVAIHLVRRLNSATLLQRLRAQGVRNADHTRALIKEKLAHDADSEIATTSLRVSLLCPLGKMRMQFPCRAVTCNHLQCFDASIYLQMNEKKPTWICPVCDKTASFDKLVLDGLFIEIFGAAPESNEIQFHEDGSWTPLIAKKEAHVVGSPAPPKITAMESASKPLSSPARKKNKVEVVDLTLDSSDDDDDSKLIKRSETKSAALAISASVPSNISTAPFSNRVSPANSSSTRDPLSPGSMFSDMPLLSTTTPPAYCPTVSSPFRDYIPPTHPMYNFPSYDFFPMMGQSDRQVPPYSLPGTSLLTCKSSSTSPDVISLD